MNIRTARENAGYTQTDLAKMLHIDPSAISLWESGKTMPRASMLIKLSGIFGCSIDFLLEHETPASGVKA